MSGFDPNALDDAALEAALSQGDAYVPPAGEPEPTPAPEAPSEEPTTPEETAQEEASPTPEPPPEPDPETERMRLLTEEMEARAKHWESVAGRNAGELGYIKQQLRAIQAAQSRGDIEEVEPDRSAPQAPPRRDGVSEWAVQQAVSQSVSSFEASHPDVTELQDKMAEYVRGTGFDMQAVLAMDNPVEAQREISRALEEAYWHTKAVVKASRRAELEQKREAIQMKSAETKLKASVSATASTPPPKPKPKTVDEMTDDELEKEMVRVQNGRW
jgi:hypothetical protein